LPLEDSLFEAPALDTKKYSGFSTIYHKMTLVSKVFDTAPPAAAGVEVGAVFIAPFDELLRFHGPRS
jgi:hypothetical protein